ncbi:MAG: hypothetical protein ABI658_26860 [Acidimicrobiales bacterium]
MMNRTRKAIVSAAMVGATLGGGALGAALLSGTASAQTDATTTAPADSSSPTAAVPAAPATPRDPSKGGHMANGITEAVLSGDVATSVSAAAQAAVPDGTIDRVETDAEGAAYEAHMTKADGSKVTVKLNADFSIAGIEAGMK